MTRSHQERFHLSSAALAASFLFAACGGGGAPAAPVEPEATTPPAAPELLSVHTIGTEFLVRWTEVADATSYKVLRNAEVAVEDVKETTARFGGGASGVRSVFVVRAVADTVESADSNELGATPMVYDAPPTDALYAKQWHLKNDGSLEPATANEDIRAEKVWAKGVDGNGVHVVVVDDGLEIRHEDLKDNVLEGASRNYIDGSADPSGPEKNNHGNACAGIIGAARDNTVGVSGVAPRASLSGRNLIATESTGTSVNSIDALSRDYAKVSVSNNSLGPEDKTGDVQPAGQTDIDAVEVGLTTGRGGLGTIYVLAAGNGHFDIGATKDGEVVFWDPDDDTQVPDRILQPVDNANLDGFQNIPGVIPVAAVNSLGKKAAYSEEGTNILVAGPSGDTALEPNFAAIPSLGIVTTDRTAEAGDNKEGVEADSTYGEELTNRNYTNRFNGTSAATPVVSGVVALVLNANPGLTYRDVRSVLASSARKNDAADPSWIVNGAGKSWSRKYGFGTVDAEAAVRLASSHTNFPEMVTVTSDVVTVNKAIPDATEDDTMEGDKPGDPVSSETTLSDTKITKVEFVTVTFNAEDHEYSPDLEVTLTSPSGTPARVAVPHFVRSDKPAPFRDIDFGVTTFMGEPADGTWKLTVQDKSEGDSGTFKSWRLRVQGH